MLIYVAGPYRGDVDGNIAKARAVAAECYLAGHDVICPHMNTAKMDEDTGLPDEFWLNTTLNLLRRCDAIVLVPGWESSKGTQAEAAYAKQVGIPVYTTVPPLHVTEQERPVQVVAFIETLMQMYRVHLSKNADYCLAPGHKVLTGDLRWIPIEDVKESMTLIGFDEFADEIDHGRRMYRPSIVESISRIVLPSYRLTLENGHTFVCSGEHPWLVSQGCAAKWVLTKNLQPQSNYPSRPSKLLKVLDVWVPSFDYESGYLSAAFDGEGWLTQCDPKGLANGHKKGKSLMLGFAQNPNAMFDYVCELLIARSVAFRVKKNKDSNLRQLIVGKPRKDVIRLLGEIRPKRLLHNLNHNMGMVDLRHKVNVVKKEFIGDVELIALRTSTKTFIADGYATHNSSANILGTGEHGVVVRIWDKVARLLNLSGHRITISDHSFEAPREPHHEAIADTYLDAANYAIIGLLVRAGVWGR